MAKDPAFLFYPSDFLTGTMFMTNEQIGIYIRLLCSQHQHGGLINKIAFNSLVQEHEILRIKFIETNEGYYNERLALVMQKRNKKSNNLSEAAKGVWINRKNEKNIIDNKSNTITLQSYNNINTIVNKEDTIALQLINVNENINKDNIYLWSDIKNTFYNDFRWIEKFCRDKKETMDNLKILMQEFLNDLELKEDFKNLKELKSHFTNLYNLKNIKNGTRNNQSNNKLSPSEGREIANRSY